MSCLERDGVAWSCGASRLLLDARIETLVLPVAIRFKLGSEAHASIALLDTGATWSVLDTSLVHGLPQREWLNLGEQARLRSRFGEYEGTIHQVDLTLVAEDGEDLVVPACVVAIEDWPGPPTLGVHGFLDRIRLALDPGSIADEARLYFGRLE